MERLSIIKEQLSPYIIEIPSQHTRIIQISRPEARNALNFSIIYRIIYLLSQARHQNNPILLTGIKSNYFGSGGDLKLVTKYYLKVPEYLRSLHHMFYLTSLLPKSTSL